jgi:hypothetical protein
MPKKTLKAIRKADQSRPVNRARRARAEGNKERKAYNEAFRSEFESPKYDKPIADAGGVLTSAGQKIVNKAHNITAKKVGYTYQSAVDKSYTKAASLIKKQKKARNSP